MKLRIVTPTDINLIWLAANHLKKAQDFLRQAKANKSHAYVTRATKSVQGALRHAYRCRNRQEAGQ